MKSLHSILKDQDLDCVILTRSPNVFHVLEKFPNIDRMDISHPMFIKVNWSEN